MRREGGSLNRKERSYANEQPAHDQSERLESDAEKEAEETQIRKASSALLLSPLLSHSFLLQVPLLLSLLLSHSFLHPLFFPFPTLPLLFRTASFVVSDKKDGWRDEEMRRMEGMENIDRDGWMNGWLA